MIKLLLIEDDTNLRYVLQMGLQEIIGGYEVKTASDGAEGLRVWREFKPDIIVSDIDMPGMNGFDMVERIRETDADTPILFASALTSPRDVTAGYKIGANNYIKKPFVPDELDAHIKAILRLKEGSKARAEVSHYKLGHYLFDANHDILRHTETGVIKKITPRQSQVLHLLVRNKNEVVKREAILAPLWEVESDYFASRSLDVIVTKLRNELKDEPSVGIRSIRGIGLMLEVQE